MIKNILDYKFESRGIEQIPDQIICEIKLSKRKYPERVVKIVDQEIIGRHLEVGNFNSIFDANENAKIGFINWIKRNPITSILIFYTALSAGTTGSIVVLVSIYTANQINRRSKDKIWRLISLVLILLIFGVMALSLLIK